MPTCGALRIGNEIHVPDAPGLVIVNVPPARSSGPSLLGPGAARDIADRGRERAQAQAVGVADDRHDEALVVEVDRDAEVAPPGARRAPSPSTVALSSGNSRSASTTARATNGSAVSRALARGRASIAE